MELLSHKKIRLVLSVFIGIFILLIGFLVYKNSLNPYGDQIEVSNLNKYLNGTPNDKDSLKYIKHNLYTTINYNTNPHVKNNSVNDAVVRDKSFSYTYSPDTHVYMIHFIVDIKSLKQSYRAQYQWVADPKYGPNIDEHGTQVTCLPLKELIYGDFSCKDMIIIENGLYNYDPVVKLLPYHVESKFKITRYTKVGGGTILYVDAYAPRSVAQLDQKTLDSYTAQIKTWLKSNKLNPGEYIVEYNNE